MQKRDFRKASDLIRINEDYALEDIKVPTLIIHTQDDPLASSQNARRMANRIPTVEFVSIPDGGHPLLGHEEFIRSTITDFLEESIESTTVER